MNRFEPWVMNLPRGERYTVQCMHWLLIVLACGGARIAQWTPLGYELQPETHLGLYGFDFGEGWL